MRILSWLCSICCTLLYVNLAVGENKVPTVSPNANVPQYDYNKILEEIGAKRILQLRYQLQQLEQLQQLQRMQDMAKKPADPTPSAQIPSPFAPYVNSDLVGLPEAMTKRSPHQVAQRSVNFKNCYFSPVQCVLLERRRRSLSSFA